MPQTLPQGITIDRIIQFDAAAVAPIRALMEQLTDLPSDFADEQLRSIIDDSASHLFLMRCHGQIVGMTTLAVYHTPTGTRAWIEDVVIDKAMRGRSLGQLIVQYAIDYARRIAPVTLMLTSRPVRIEANALYLRSGFAPKQTNVYKMEL